MPREAQLVQGVGHGYEEVGVGRFARPAYNAIRRHMVADRDGPPSPPILGGARSGRAFSGRFLGRHANAG